MNDKEILMMAAKAYSKDIFEGDGGCGADRVRGAFYYSVVCNGGVREWNPITKETDALRLAAKLSLSIFYSEQFVEINFDDESGKVDFFSVIEFFPPDDFEMKMAATMLAITRAAAEIGSKL